MSIINPITFAATIKFDYLSNVEINNADIMDCYFVEDIYSMATFGRISIYDRYSIKEYGPLTGDEKILITYGNTGLIEKIFTIYKIAKVEGVVEFKQTSVSVINLYFVDIYYNNLIMKKFSKSWKENTLGTDIVKDVVENLLGVEVSSNIDIEPSKDKFKTSFYIPQWNAAETIRYISNRITGTKGKYGYLFFSNSKKFMNYVTLDGLFKNAPKDSQTYLFDTTDINYENKIQAWEVMGVDHTGVKELGGGQMLGFDVSTKSFLGIEEDEEFVYSKAIKQITSMGNSSLFDGNMIDNQAKNFNYAYHSEGEADKTILKNMFYNNFIRRYSLQNMVKILTTGHDKRFAGQKVEIMWPSTSTKEIYNSMDSGQHLIKSITHSFNPQRTPMYRQTIVLIKNAYNSKTGSNTSTSGFNLFDFILSKI
jgi:hypothetical protein